MKRVLMIVFAVFFAINTYSQELDFGLKAGVNFATIEDTSLSLDNRTGFHAGLFLAIKFNDRFAIQPEMLYSQQGADFDLGKFDLDYVNFPIVMKLYVVNGLNIQFGPQFGFVVNDEISFAGIAGDAEAEKFDVSGLLGVGVDMPFGLRIDARYNLGFLDVSKDSDGKNSVFSLSLGYSFF
jgi:hypothetical protein